MMSIPPYLRLPIRSWPRTRRGSVLIYAIVSMGVLLLMASLAVDFGRFQLAKTELRNAADDAARYAVNGMASSSTQVTTAQEQAAAAVADWTVDVSKLSSSNLTTTLGVWSAATNTFTANTSSPNAVKIDLVYAFTPGGGRPPLFLNAIAPSMAPTVHATTIAMLKTTNANTFYPPAAGNLWLAGMPAGTLTQNFRPDNSVVWDTAGTTTNPQESPLQLTLSQLGISAGNSLSFEGLSGTATYVANSTANSADGDSTFLVALGQTYPGSVPTNNMNGMSNVVAPIGAIMAVFLNDNEPDTQTAPSGLDFSTDSERDYSTISPQLQQVFFVGDGKRDDGEVQHIVVPKGATRVFIGMMDAWQWNDNLGDFKFNEYGNQGIVTVK